MFERWSRKVIGSFMQLVTLRTLIGELRLLFCVHFTLQVPYTPVIVISPGTHSLSRPLIQGFFFCLFWHFSGLGGWLGKSAEGNSWCDPFKVSLITTSKADHWKYIALTINLLAFFLDVAKGTCALFHVNPNCWKTENWLIRKCFHHWWCFTSNLDLLLWSICQHHACSKKIDYRWFVSFASSISISVPSSLALSLKKRYWRYQPWGLECVGQVSLWSEQADPQNLDSLVW